MELEYLGVILDAKKEDYTKQVNLKKFYKETLTDEEYKNFEKMLKTKKAEITELETVVKKMSAYSDQYVYERINAMSETEFDAIKEKEIEYRKNEIRKHNKGINEKNIALNTEIDRLNDDIFNLKRELEKMTEEIGETGSYTKESVNRAKTIKETIQADQEKIKENRKVIEDNDKSIITNEDIKIDYESYKKEKIDALPGKKYTKVIPEVSILDEFFCKVQKRGKTPSEIEEAMNEFKNSYIGGFSKEGYEYFDPVYRKDFDCLEEDDNAKVVTELLEKYFEVSEKNAKGVATKGRIERSRIVGYNTNKRHNISEITKERLLNELIDGDPFYNKIKENEVVSSGIFLSLTDRIKLQTRRLNKVSYWSETHPELSAYAKILDLIEEYFEITKDRDTEEKNIDTIYDIYKKLRKQFEKEYFADNKDAIDYMALYDDFSSSCDKLKSLATSKAKISGKKLVINKKEHSKNIDTLEEEIVKEQENIKKIRRKMKNSLDRISDFIYDTFDTPEKIMYPEEVEEGSKDSIFNILHKRNKDEDFSLSDEQIYLNELEYDLNLAKQYLDKYAEYQERNKNASIVDLARNLGIQSVSPAIMDALVEERAKKGSYKASEISSRINEARVNLYLREQKEKALSDASKAKSEILGAVLNHLDLEETKTDIFAAI